MTLYFNDKFKEHFIGKSMEASFAVPNDKVMSGKEARIFLAGERELWIEEMGTKGFI